MAGLNSDNCRILQMTGKERSLANLRRAGRIPGTKNKINRSMQEVIRQVWEELQDDPETSLLAMAKQNPQWFYELCKGMFQRFIYRGRIEFKQHEHRRIRGRTIPAFG